MGPEGECKPLESKVPWYPLDALRRVVTLKGPDSTWPKLSLVLSGHAHLFQFFGANEPEVPVQLVVGTGGDALDGVSIEEFENATLYGVKGRLWTRKMYGFVMLTREDPDPGWKAAFYDVNGDAVVNCTLGTRSCN